MARKLETLRIFAYYISDCNICIQRLAKRMRVEGWMFQCYVIEGDFHFRLVAVIVVLKFWLESDDRQQTAGPGLYAEVSSWACPGERGQGAEA